MSAEKLDQFIDGLAEDCPTCKPLEHPLKRLIPLFVFMGVYFTFAVQFLGVRLGLEDKLSDSYFLFEVITMGAVALSASFAASWLTIPDMRGSKWLLAVPPALFGIFLVWSSIRSITEGMGFGAADIHWNHCVMDALIMGLVPGFIMVLFARGGATTRPNMMMLMNVLTITGFSYIGLRMTCAMDNVAHGTVLHLIPFIGIGILTAFIARKVFHW